MKAKIIIHKETHSITTIINKGDLNEFGVLLMGALYNENIAETIINSLIKGGYDPKSEVSLPVIYPNSYIIHLESAPIIEVFIGMDTYFKGNKEEYTEFIQFQLGGLG